MSYPEPASPGEYPPVRYHRDAGELSAMFRPASTEHELVNRSGSAAYLATGATTNGEFGLYLWNMGPKPSGPAPHFHKTISESFYVLSGTVRLYDGEKWIDATKGDFLFVPEGGVHAFRNESGEPASMLLLFAPGAPREGYFEGLAGLAELSDEERTEFFLRHDTYWL